MWSIWLSRNEIVFDDKVLDTAALEDIIKVRIASWVKARLNLSSSTQLVISKDVL